MYMDQSLTLLISRFFMLKFLYPPLTYLKPKKKEEIHVGECLYQVVHVEPCFAS